MRDIQPTMGFPSNNSLYFSYRFHPKWELRSFSVWRTFKTTHQDCPSFRGPLKSGNKWSILNVIIERHTHSTSSVSPILSEVLQFLLIHLNLAVSPCPPLKRADCYGISVIFVKGGGQVMIYQGSPGSFFKTKIMLMNQALCWPSSYWPEVTFACILKGSFPIFLK